MTDRSPEARRTLEFVVAQLRHAYSQLVNPEVECDRVSFAEGLIGPQILRLEKLLTEDAATRPARAETPKFAVEAWDSGDYVVTKDGKPIGQSVTGFANARYIALWLPTAWKELLPEDAARAEALDKEP